VVHKGVSADFDPKTLGAILSVYDLLTSNLELKVKGVDRVTFSGKNTVQWQRVM
jgi:hypothetical protein